MAVRVEQLPLGPWDGLAGLGISMGAVRWLRVTFPLERVSFRMVALVPFTCTWTSMNSS
jgi:hypothetical protein